MRGTCFLLGGFNLVSRLGLGSLWLVPSQGGRVVSLSVLSHSTRLPSSPFPPQVQVPNHTPPHLELHIYMRIPAALLRGEAAPRGQDPALSFGVTRTRVVPSPVTLPSCAPTMFHFRTTGLGHRRRWLEVCTHVDLRRGARRERNAAPPSPSPSFIPAAYFNK